MSDPIIAGGRPIRTVMQVGDLHLRTSELEDQVPVLDWIADLCDERDVDLVILCGDLSGRAAPHLSRPAERNALIRLLRRLHEDERHVVVVRGNHDVPDDWTWISEAWPGDGSAVRAWVTVPTTFEFTGLTLHCLPYPDRSWVAAGAKLDRGELTRQVEGGLSAICGSWAAGKRPGDVSIVTAHCATRGAESSTGQPMIGTDVEVPVSTLIASGADVVLLNHIHKPQTARDGRVVHVGSPWPSDFGEVEEKRVVLAHVGPDGVRLESVPTPCVRRVSVDMRWTGDGWEVAIPWHQTDGARVRLRLHYDKGDPIDVAAAESLAHGAVDVKIDRIPRRTRRERAPEVVAAQSPVDRYIAFERSEGREPDAREVAMARAVVDGTGIEWLGDHHCDMTTDEIRRSLEDDGINVDAIVESVKHVLDERRHEQGMLL